MGARITVDLTDPVMAAHFARAVAAHAAWARTQRIDVPNRLIEAGLDAKKWATAVHSGPELPCACETGDGESVGLLSFTRAAELLGKSVSTVKRLVADGELLAVRVGSSRRSIRRSDLEDFLRGLEPVNLPEGTA